MKLVDVHCHLDEEFFKDDIDEVIENAKKHKVNFIVPAGVNPETNRYILKIREKYPNVIYPALGIYPPDALTKETGKPQQFDVDEEIKFILKNKENVFAIGEVGMDFKNGTQEDQEPIFRKMIELAIKLDKPLVVHSRKAEEQVINILEEYDFKRIIMHCFSGKQSLVKRIRKNSWWFSIPTNIVRDEHFQRIVKETPISQLLTETDAPFLSPFKDKKNEPAFVTETIKKIADIKKLNHVDVINLIWKNTKYVFNI